MGFFQDLKEDLSQAVNELMPDDNMALEKERNEKVSVEEEQENVTPDNNMSKEPENKKEFEEEDIHHILNEALGSQSETSEEDEDLRILEEQLKALEEEENAKLARQAENDAVEELEEIEELDEAAGEAVSELLKSDNTVGQVLDKAAEIKKENTSYKMGEKKMAEQTTKLTGVATDETSIITAGMTITGNVSSKGSMEVVGTINGDVETLGKLDVTGSIKGNSKAAEVYAESARITGEIRSEGTIKIGQSSVIIGNIFAKSAVIAGAVKGDIDVQGPVVLDTSAIVMGNIKSKSVQINNGAVIEGLCSQCYADVNPTSFFEDYK